MADTEAQLIRARMLVRILRDTIVQPRPNNPKALSCRLCQGPAIPKRHDKRCFAHEALVALYESPEMLFDDDIEEVL